MPKAQDHMATYQRIGMVDPFAISLCTASLDGAQVIWRRN